MVNSLLQGGTVHALPSTLQRAIHDVDTCSTFWTTLTPLARNEWICFIESAKLKRTRERRTARMLDQLTRGQRRPCCWEGCPHREKIQRTMK